MNFIDTLLGKLAPHLCMGCGQEGTLLCPICADILADPTIHTAQGNLNTIRAVTLYEGFAKDLVWQFKFRGAREAASVMARYMAPLVRTEGNAIIVPVPTASRRVRQRGFDQAKLLARQLSRQTGLRYADCLRRYGQTHQVGTAREQRLTQLKDAFRTKTKHLCDSHVILIDDVLTTGATLEAAAGMVRVAGARRIDAAVFAQA
jgi:ComF family protein